MKKVWLVSVLATALLGSMAAAQDYHHYVSGKGAAVRLENKLTGNGNNEATQALYNVNHKKSDTVAGLRIAYGISMPLWGNNLRTELEYGYNGKAKLEGSASTPDLNYKSDIKSQFVMANVYYDFDLDSNWTPYVGAGIGYARVKADNQVNFGGEVASLSKSSGNFAWNLTAGISYEMTDNLSIDASYRYIDYGKVKNSGSLELGAQKYRAHSHSKVRSNELNLGIRYRLNYQNN